jgi:nicotinate phosphoribosyltransferase
MASRPHVPPQHSLALFTDLYELTMAQAYDAERMEQPAVFELFFRKLPPSRNYIVAAGLADVLEYLESLHFSDDDLAYLRGQKLFSEGFLSRLARLRFTGDVYALPEGTPVFPHEPLIQVVAPMIEAQLVETFLLNQVHFQSVAATKAARVVSAAAGRPVVDFGSRRAHGTDAALKVARTSYLAGAIGTSNVLAGKIYGIPIFGTMAHSYIQAHDQELEAFEAFARKYGGTTLLVDTYDTLQGVRNVIELARRLGETFTVRMVRLDSGDLSLLARQTRQLLDEAGLSQVRIFASSGLDEYAIARLVADGAPIDVFGVGTQMAVISDAPALDMAYKLVEYAGRGRTKFSRDKVLWPGRKQIYRQVAGGILAGDELGLWDERLDGEPLLVPVMQSGKRLPAGAATLADAREYCRRQQAALPPAVLGIERAAELYPVRVSAGLQRKMDALAHDSPA